MKTFTIKPIAWAVSLAFCSHSYAFDTHEVVDEHNLPDTTVVAESLEDETGTTKYSKEQINSTVGGNGDIQSVLVRTPGVQFDNAALSSTNPGDIDPKKISINGSKTYDTQVSIDGFSINNGMSGGVVTESETTSAYVAADRYQSMAVDTKLLCNLTVYDSNVSAKYGKFSGGVVDGEVCAPQKKFSGGLSLEYSSSKWLENKNKDLDNTTKYSTSPSNHSEFEKWTYRGNFESKISERFGIVGSYSQKTSEIPLRAYSNNFLSKADELIKYNKTKSENFYVKTFFNNGHGDGFDISLMSNPVDISGFFPKVKNSGYTSKAGGDLFSVSLKNNSVFGFKLTNKIFYKKTNSSRYTDMKDRYHWVNRGDKNWGGFNTARGPEGTISAEGGYGDIEQEEKAVGYSFDLGSPKYKIGSLTKSFNFGFEWEKEEYTYSRMSSGATYTYVANSGSGSCINSNGVLDPYCIPGPNGQYANFLNSWQAGTINHDTSYKSIYIEELMSIDRFKARLGLRWEKDSDAQKPVVAPRFMTSFDMLQDRSLSAEFGANRYYTKNLKAYYVMKNKAVLSSGGNRRRASISSPWGPGNTQPWAFHEKPDGVNQPYADEISFALTKILHSYKIQAKYVDRLGKDEIIMRRLGAAEKQTLTPVNAGETKYQRISLSLESMSPLKLMKSKTDFYMAIDFEKKKSTTNEWSVGNEYEDTNGLQTIASYKGKLMLPGELPAQNYHRPWTFRMTSSTDFGNGLKVDGIFRVRPGYTKITNVKTVTKKVNNINVERIDYYEDIDLKKSINFDLKITKSWKFGGDRNLYAELGIENVFNRTNQYGYNADNEIYTNEKGRQATLRVGYEF